MTQIVTRFPPSPTGYLHVGGARTALFNWLYARRMNGKFVLRIEDTDAERSTQASVDAIFEALEWLGIDWDDGPYYQTRRLTSTASTSPSCSTAATPTTAPAPPSGWRQMRRRPWPPAASRSTTAPAANKAAPWRHGGGALQGPAHRHHRARGRGQGQHRVPERGARRFRDLPQRRPATYNFAVVVDDITMGINTIIRGDDHVMNTPKQIQLYRAFGCPLPLFAHVPMVLGKDRTRLSKRHGATSVTAYRDMGYLPEALINYLVRLGWSHGDQEFFTREELIDVFNLENIGRSAGVFDLEKLQALNADHIKATPAARLVAPLAPFLHAHGVEIEAGAHTERVIATLSARSKTLRRWPSRPCSITGRRSSTTPEAAANS